MGSSHRHLDGRRAGYPGSSFFARPVMQPEKPGLKLVMIAGEQVLGAGHTLTSLSVRERTFSFFSSVFGDAH